MKIIQIMHWIISAILIALCLLFTVELALKYKRGEEARELVVFGFWALWFFLAEIHHELTQNRE